jgi:hypothetical protein
MRSLLSLTLAATLAASLLGASTASAATEIGDACTADNEFSAPVTFFEASAPSNPLPLAVPSAGVLTKWKVNLIPEVPFTFSQTLKVLRLNTAAHTALVIGETNATIVSGSNTIDARIPVQAGDRVSIFGAGFVETLVCTTPGVENLIGGFGGNGGGVGSSNPYIELPEEFRVPVAAVIEPDADGDGYGDETQDKCPQSAAVQAECPLVVLDAYPVPGKNKVVVLVSTSNEASVTVSGSVKLPKAATSASASAVAKLKKVTRKVTPGKIGRFTLKFPGSLKQALGDLPAGKKLKLKITASAKNVAGQVSKDKTTLKLKGAV